MFRSLYDLLVYRALMAKNQVKRGAKSEVWKSEKNDLNFAIYDLLVYKGLMTFYEFSFLEKITVQVLVEQGRH